MSMHCELDRYLNIRRMFGAKLETDELRLRSFVTFADRDRAEYITIDLILRWMQSLQPFSAATRAARFCAVRHFAEWLHGIDARHEAPPPRGFIPGRSRRLPPYIYSDVEIVQIIEGARNLPSIYGMRGLTCATLFGLIAMTGLRIGEALDLDTSDLDAEHGVLRIRRGKNGKERLLPLDPSVVRQLAEYCAERDRLLERRSQAFFLNCKGARPDYCWARANFVRACQNIGLRGTWAQPTSGRSPRIHDLRHTFAVRTLIGWYRSGKDPTREMHRLTTYLGHEGPRDTYWYLEAVPELLELAAARVESCEAREVRP